MNIIKEQYKDFLDKQNYIPIFGQVWWLEVCATEGGDTEPKTDGWNVTLATDDGGNVLGAMPYAFRKRWGRKMVEMPPLTPWFPVIMAIPDGTKLVSKYNWENKILSQLVTQLPKTIMLAQMCHYSLTNMLPFAWAGFLPIARSTYIIDLQQDLNTIFLNFRENTRRNIRKAEKKLSIETRDDAQLFYEVNAKTFERQQMKVGYSLSYWKNLYAQIKQNQAGELLFALDTEGGIHAALCIVWDTKVVYFLVGGADTDLRESGAMSLLFWEVVRRCRAKGLQKFDLVGANFQHIERFKLGFGGERVNYFRMLKFNNRILAMLFALKK